MKYLRILHLVIAITSISVSSLAQGTTKKPAQPLAGPGPYSIEQYLTIKAAGGPSFSPDGKFIVHLSNTTGTTQVYVTTVANRQIRQLTNYEDNVSFVRWLSDGTGMVFGKAKGGDENTQFFWMKPDGTSVRPLTNDPTVRHNLGVVAANGKWIAYASNKRNRQFFDIYTLEIATGKETLVAQFDGSQSVVAANADATMFIISRDGTELSLDNDLYLLKKNGDEVLITPHIGSSQYGNVAFLPDGKSLLLAQNDGREFLSLTNLRLKNAANSSDWSDANREMRIVDETNWDVNDVELSPQGSSFAYTINDNGYSRLFTHGIETGGKPLVTFFAQKPTEVKLPLEGIISGLTFSLDGSKLAFAFNSATKNSDIWVYDLKTKNATQITKSDLSGIQRQTFVAPQLVYFNSFDGKQIPAWYYRPTPKPDATLTGKTPKTVDINTPGDADQGMLRKDKSRPPLAHTYDGSGTGGATASLLPVIISVHGGPEAQERPGFNPLYQYYLSRGYAILAPNVRGSTGYGKAFTHLDDVEKREDSVKDLAASVMWLQVNGGADKNRIAVMGGSYGGYMTMAAITLYPDLFAAAVNTVGIVNWETFLKNTSSYRRRQREVEYGRLDKNLDFLRSISPIAKAESIKTPLFVIHGKNDPRVPYTEAEQLVKAIRDRGGVVDYKLYNDEGHGISKLKNRLELFPLVADFLDKNMK
ncbi:MAG TPA: S9 family peptidase [Pyrinomonadaceae bacterium]|nr:S9 family peptidase [Pyrinomonadaceae bacterium]